METVEYEADSDEEEDTADVVNDKRANSRRILVMMKSLAPQDHDLEEDGENILMGKAIANDTEDHIHNAMVMLILLTIMIKQLILLVITLMRRKN